MGKQIKNYMMYYQGCICMCVCWGQTANDGSVSPLLLGLTEISNPESKSLEPCDPQCQDIILSFCAETIVEPQSKGRIREHVLQFS